MKDWQEYFKGKKITLMGLGLLGRGVGVAKFLAECGAQLTITDLKPLNELRESISQLDRFLNIRFVLGEHRLKDFSSADLVIKAAGVPIDSPYIEEAKLRGVAVEMDASLFAKLVPEGVAIIGVTGTRGKSTVTQIIYEILKAALRQSSGQAGKRVFLGGNVKGMATLPLLKQVKAGDYVILELDSWQLQGFDDSKLSPHIAVFTTFLRDHLNYYKGNISRYLEDKSAIFRHQKMNDYLIVGEPIAKLIQERYPGRIKGKFLIASSADVPVDWQPQIFGEHNLLNIACALKVAEILKLPKEIVEKAVEEFRGVPGRLELVVERDGIKYFNSTNATTPEATLADLKALREKYLPSEALAKEGPETGIILIAGGADKGLDFSEFVREAPKYIKALILFKGTASDKIKKVFPFEELPIYSDITSMEGALKLAREEALRLAQGKLKGEVIILLSPGAASFGVFKNEYDRGDQFNELVRKL